MRTPWLFIALVSALLSVMAKAAPGLPLPSDPRDAIEAFASPGELLCQSTIGGVLPTCPSGLAGDVVRVLGTAAFWSIAAVVVVAVGSQVLRLGGR